jgi:hypothetical protein
MQVVPEFPHSVGRLNEFDFRHLYGGDEDPVLRLPDGELFSTGARIDTLGNRYRPPEGLPGLELRLKYHLGMVAAARDAFAAMKHVITGKRGEGNFNWSEQMFGPNPLRDTTDSMAAGKAGLLRLKEVYAEHVAAAAALTQEIADDPVKQEHLRVAAVDKALREQRKREFDAWCAEVENIRLEGDQYA